MKIKYILVILVSFFVYQLNSNALLALCSYQCRRADVTEGGVSSDIMIEKCKRGQSVLMFDKTRSELYLSFVDKSSMTQSSVPIPVVDWFLSSYNSIAYSDMVNLSSGTFVRFNPDLTRGEFWGATLSNNRYVTVKWLLPTFNEDGSPDYEKYPDPKQQYVEEGICPEWFFYNGDSTGEIKHGATVYFANHESLVDPKGGAENGIGEILDDNNYLYHLQWSIIKGYTFTADQLNTETSLNIWRNKDTGEIAIGGNGLIPLCIKVDEYDPDNPNNLIGVHYYNANKVEVADEATWKNQCKDPNFEQYDLGIGVKDLLKKLINGEYYKLTDEQLQVASILLNIGFGTASATDREKFMFTRILDGYFTEDSPDEHGLYYHAANALITFSKNKDSMIHKDRYKDLLEAAHNYMTYATGSKSIADPDVKDKCNAVLGDVNDKESFAYHLQLIFRFVQFLGPILVIVLTTVDYFKVLLSGDDNGVKKVNGKTVKRLIAIVCLFFIPLFIQLLLKLFDIVSDCGIS